MVIVAGRYRRNGEAETLGCLVQLLLLLVAMPFVGLYLLINPNSMSKGLGLLLTVFGVAMCLSIKKSCKRAPKK